MKNKVDFDTCMGCGLCKAVCGQGAVSQQIDEEGFLQYVVDDTLCSRCHKCTEVCPAASYQTDNYGFPDCYAVCADDSIRENSTSGGTFSLLAQYILALDGYVCGVSLKDFRPVYTAVSGVEELRPLQTAKYIEAEAGDIYGKVAGLLAEDKPVLFVGTPCKVAALYGFLQDRPKKLFTVDLVCHGVSSPMVFDRFREAESHTRTVTGFSFSSKKKGWRPDLGELAFQEGGSLLTDKFHYLHDNCMILRKCCYSCGLAELPRVGDLTLGSFYSIEQYDPMLNDKKGINLVLVNNDKGKELFSGGTVRAQVKKKVPLRHGLEGNRFFSKYGNYANRERFFDLAAEMNFPELYDTVRNGRYDVAVFTNWSSFSFRAHISSYALYEALSSLGLSVLMVEKPDMHPFPPLEQPEKFRRNPYKPYGLSRLFASLEDMGELGKRCQAFVVGADQFWNPLVFGHSQGFYTLSFLNNICLKIAYGTSFGSGAYRGSPEDKQFFQENLCRFDYLSSTDAEGVTLYREEFGLDAQQVAAPVFLCAPAVYENLMKHGRVRGGYPYIFTFVNRPFASLEELLLDISDALGKPMVNMRNEFQANMDKDLWSLPTILSPYIEDWLCYINSSSLVITDTLEAVWFSILFRRDFVFVFDEAHPEKYEVMQLLEQLNLGSRCLCAESLPGGPMDEGTLSCITAPVDYGPVYQRLEEQKQASLRWLKSSLGGLFEKKNRGKEKVRQAAVTK